MFKKTDGYCTVCYSGDQEDLCSHFKFRNDKMEWSEMLMWFGCGTMIKLVASSFIPSYVFNLLLLLALIGIFAYRKFNQQTDSLIANLAQSNKDLRSAMSGNKQTSNPYSSNQPRFSSLGMGNNNRAFGTRSNSSLFQGQLGGRLNMRNNNTRRQFAPMGGGMGGRLQTDMMGYRGHISQTNGFEDDGMIIRTTKKATHATPTRPNMNSNTLADHSGTSNSNPLSTRRNRRLYTGRRSRASRRKRLQETKQKS
eukprot:g1725.t1